MEDTSLVEFSHHNYGRCKEYKITVNINNKQIKQKHKKNENY